MNWFANRYYLCAKLSADENDPTITCTKYNSYQELVISPNNLPIIKAWMTCDSDSITTEMCNSIHKYIMPPCVGILYPRYNLVSAMFPFSWYTPQFMDRWYIAFRLENYNNLEIVDNEASK